MIDVAMALKERINKFMTASSLTTEPAVAGDKTLKINPAESLYFNLIRTYKSYPKIGISTGTTGGFFGNKIIEVDTENGILHLKTPLIRNVGTGSLVKRTPGYKEIKLILLGDVETISKYPAIIIDPGNLTRKWLTIGNPVGSDETFHIKIKLYVADDNSESSTIALMSATQELDDLLMSDLHMKIPDLETSIVRRVYNSKVSDVSYGYLKKSSTFIKGSELNWEASEFLMRLVATPTKEFEHFNYDPGEQY